MDPAAYMKHNRIPNLYAKDFIKEIAETTDWKNENLDMVMDIGCGPGNISTYWIDHYFPNIKRLIGLDMDPVMIDLAKGQNKKENIEFHVADILEKDSLKEWEGKVNWIFSHFVLQRVKDQKQALRNMFYLLRPSSEAALRFLVKSPYFLAFMDLLKTPKWNRILEPTNTVIRDGLIKKYDAAHYKKMFEDVGFRVLECESKLIELPFLSDNECKNFLMSLQCIGEVSDELREEYKKDIFEQYLKYSHRDTEGRPVNNLIVLDAKLLKDCSDQRKLERRCSKVKPIG